MNYVNKLDFFAACMHFLVKHAQCLYQAVFYDISYIKMCYS